jgi:hypothetical protein
MKKLAYLLPTLFSFVAVVSVASAQINPTYFNSSANSINSFINGQLIPLLFGVAIVVFLWGMIKTFLLGSADESKREEGKKLMLWGILAFVFMTALWGIVTLVTSLFGINPTQTAPIGVPRAPGGAQ